jgi:hypothetical protein
VDKQLVRQWLARPCSGGVTLTVTACCTRMAAISCTDPAHAREMRVLGLLWTAHPRRRLTTAVSNTVRTRRWWTHHRTRGGDASGSTLAAGSEHTGSPVHTPPDQVNSSQQQDTLQQQPTAAAAGTSRGARGDHGHAEMEALWAGARAVVVHALWDRPVAACITVVIMVVPLALAYLLFSEYDIHPWQLWVSHPLYCGVALSCPNAGHMAVQPMPRSKHATSTSSARWVCWVFQTLHGPHPSLWGEG